MKNDENNKSKFHKLVFNQTISQEIANSITHGIGALLSIAAIVLLVVSSSFSGSALKIVSFSIFGFTLFFVFISSTLYHGLTQYKAKSIFLKFDHIAIYCLIAGTYTPLVLITIGGWYGWLLFGIIWSITIAGTLVTIFLHGASADKLSVGIYISMGWIVIFFLKVILQRLPMGGIVFLFTGGILYTIGTVFFLFKKLKYSHAIWHLFVIAAAVCHFFCIILFV